VFAGLLCLHLQSGGGSSNAPVRTWTPKYASHHTKADNEETLLRAVTCPTSTFVNISRGTEGSSENTKSQKHRVELIAE